MVLPPFPTPFFFFPTHGLLVPQSGFKPVAPALEGTVLTTGPPGKSSISLPPLDDL